MGSPETGTVVSFHLAGSVALLCCCGCIIAVYLLPDAFPDVYRVLADQRIAAVLPYLLFIALSNALFSLWYLVFRK